MTAFPSVTLRTFVDSTDMPEVHSDERRTIYEKIVEGDGKVDRTARIVVTAHTATLGNHYHDFVVHLSGQGKGMLYLASKDNLEEIFTQQLPEDGWAVTIPAEMVHTFVMQQGAILIEKANQHFLDGVNTHRLVIAPS